MCGHRRHRPHLHDIDEPLTIFRFAPEPFTPRFQTGGAAFQLLDSGDSGQSLIQHFGCGRQIPSSPLVEDRGSFIADQAEFGMDHQLFAHLD